MTHDGGGNVTADDRVGTTYDYRYNKRGRIDQVSVGTQVRADRFFAHCTVLVPPSS